MDSPGVIFDDDSDTGDFKRSKAGASLTLRNVIKVEDIGDPIEVGSYPILLVLIKAH